MPRISVLVATRSRPAALLRCLESILRQDHPAFEVHVFDDAGEPDARAIVAKLEDSTKVQVHHAAANVGVAEARNQLMMRARGDILCHLDDDAYLGDPSVLRNLDTCFAHHADAAIIAGKILDWRDGRWIPLVPIPRRVLRRNPVAAEDAQEVGSFLGGLHAIRRTAFVQYGGYDPALIFGAEELDLSYRYIGRGGTIVYCPRIWAFHRRGVPDASGPGAQARRTFLGARNLVWLAYRYLPWPYATSFVLLWGVRLFAMNLANGSASSVLAGFLEGFRTRRRYGRRPLSGNAVRYLKARHGRLWY